MSLMEQFLQESCAKNPSLAMLNVHWQEISRRQSGRLSLIREYFPHYTGHDAQHSERILDALCTLLGRDKASVLPPVDLWLLCTAAWYHDLGMTLTLEDKQQLLRDPKFLIFIEDLKKDESRPLHECALLFKTDLKARSLICSEHIVTVQSMTALRYLIADYIRADHAGRSQRKMLTDELLCLTSDDLPRRLLVLLGQICAAHGASRERLLDLPLTEYTGLGDEECHPRLLAALLRLGDLLDLDSTRVPEDLIASLGYLPSDSIAHLQAARSITHFTLNPELIEITAECADTQTLKVLDNWFKLIEEEHRFQSGHWHLICPHKSLASLPALGDLCTYLDGSEPIGGEIIPRFLYDEKAVFALLRGANIYEDRTQALRELIQNAIDAIYLRVFVAWQSEREKDEQITLQRFKQMCAEHHIKITIKETEAPEQSSVADQTDVATKKNEPNERKFWQVTVEDDGIGMNEEDLECLLTVGHPKRKKYRIIAQMPVWMRPSGIFGVGFQSVFLLTDKVTLSTQKSGDGRRYELELNSPEKQNFVVCRAFDGNCRIGTTVSFVADAAPADVERYKQMNQGYPSGRFVLTEENSYDGSCAETLNQYGSLLADEAFRSIELCWIKCSVTHNDGRPQYNFPDREFFEYYDEKTNLELHLRSDAIHRGGCAFHFRNQELKQCRLELKFLGFVVNILGYDADEILTLSRNDLKASGKNLLLRQLKESAFRYVEQFFDRLKLECQNIDDPKEERLRVRASFFCDYYAPQLSASNLPDLKTEQWQNILNYWKTHTFNKLLDLLSKPENLVLVKVKIDWEHPNDEHEVYHFTFYERKNKGGFRRFNFEYENNSYDENLEFALTLLPRMFPVMHRVRSDFYTLRIDSGAGTDNRSRGDIKLKVHTREAKLLLARDYLSNLRRFRRWYCLCPDDYPELRVRGDVQYIESEVFEEYHLPAMLCPFAARYDKGYPPDLHYDLTDDLVANTQKFSAHTPPPFQDEIKGAFERFRAEYETSFLNAARGEYL